MKLLLTHVERFILDGDTEIHMLDLHNVEPFSLITTASQPYRRSIEDLVYFAGTGRRPAETVEFTR